MIDKNFQCRNNEAIEYLELNPNLVKFLVNALKNVSSIFGDDTSVIFEYIDTGLVGWIQFNGSIEDGLDRLDKLSDKYLYHPAFGYRFNFNIEFPNVKK